MTHSLLAQAADSISYWPLGILAISVVFIVFSIIKLKLHPFLALIFAAVLTGLLTGDLPGMTTENVGLFKNRVALNDTPDDTTNDMLLALNWSFLGFGNTAGGIGFVVALAAIIGTCMLGSGAADRVVRALMNLFGEKRAGLVLLLSGFLLSIPVFFDTVFFLLIPLARALSLRTGKSYTLYVIAMAGQGAITHSMVPPTPGPLMIANGLKLDLGLAMMAGLSASILPAILVLFLARKFDSKFNIPMRDTPGASTSDLKSIVDKKENWSLPPLSCQIFSRRVACGRELKGISCCRCSAFLYAGGVNFGTTVGFYFETGRWVSWRRTSPLQGGLPDVFFKEHPERFPWESKRRRQAGGTEKEIRQESVSIYTLAAQMIGEKRISEGGVMSTLAKSGAADRVGLMTFVANNAPGFRCRRNHQDWEMPDRTGWSIRRDDSFGWRWRNH